MRFWKHLQNQLSSSLFSDRELSKERDFINDNPSISVISFRDYSQISPAFLSSTTTVQSSPEFATFAHRNKIANGIETNTKITTPETILKEDSTNNCKVHSSTNPAVASVPISLKQLGSNHNPNNSIGKDLSSQSLCPVEPVILSLTPVHCLIQKDNSGGGGITSLFSSHRRSSSAPHASFFNGNERPSANLQRRFSYKVGNSEHSEFSGKSINFNFKVVKSSETPGRIEGQERSKSSNIDDPPFREEFAVHLGEEGENKDENTCDDYKDDSGETNNRISKNNIFLASPVQLSNFAETNNLEVEALERKQEYQEVNPRHTSFPGNSGVDEIKLRKSRRRSIATSIYSTAGTRIWDNLRDDRLHSCKESRKKGTERKVLCVDSNSPLKLYCKGKVEKDIEESFILSLEDSHDDNTLSNPPMRKEFEAGSSARLEKKEQGGIITRRDQNLESSFSRCTTFTRERPSSNQSESGDSIYSYFSTDSSSNSVCKEDSSNSAPVVVPFITSEASFSPSVTSQPEFLHDIKTDFGKGLPDKVYEKRKSKNGRSNNGNVNSSKSSNNNNSEISRVSKRKPSIIQCLLCTEGFNLVDSPKKLFTRVFLCGFGNTSVVRPNHLRQNRQIQTFSYSSSYLQSSRNKPKRRKRLVRFKTREDRPLTKAQLKLWATMDHEDLIRELPQIEKLSNQERLRLAHKRRMLQLKKFQQYEKDLNSNSKKHRGESDLVRRNLPGKHNQHYGQGRKGSRRIRFRNSIMLLEAAGRNDVEEVRLLLESGVNPDVANEDGLTALHQCCIDDNEEMMKLLLDFGANVNAEDSEKWTPLHAAATCGHLHLVQHLIYKSANLLAVNAEGNMPYDICDDETTLDYIESEMAKRGVTQELIEEIRALPETRMLQEIQRIHAVGGDLECRDVDGATPLHIASANGYYRVAEFLLDNHVATDVQDKDFWQPIHAAACWGHLDVLELLVQNGADLDARTKNNETPYAICEDPEIKERIIQLRTEQQTKRQNEGRKRPSRTHSTNSRTQSIRRTSQRDKGLTSKRDAADEAQMLRAREELHKENSPSPTSDGTTGKNNTTSVAINGNATTVNGVVHPLNGDTHNNIQNGNNASSEEDPEERNPIVLGRDSVGHMKMKQDEMNRLREIAVRSGAMNHNQLNNQNVIPNGSNGGVKMNNLLYENTGSLVKNQNNIQKNLNNAASNGGNSVTVLSSPDDNGNLLPKPEINPSVDNKVALGGPLANGLSGSRDNLVGLSSSAGNSTIDIHVSVTINTNSPVSTLTNGANSLGGGSHSLHNGGLPLSPSSSIFTPPGTLSDLKKQRSLIRTSSNPLTNGGMNDSMTKYHPPASPTMSLRRYVGDAADTVGDYGDGGKRCCVIV